MSAISTRAAGGRRTGRRGGPRADDPRVIRSRAAVVQAARELFLSRGFGGTTMEDVAAAAGLTKRTVYNNYADKEALFTEVVTAVIAQAEAFARALPAEFTRITAANLRPALHDLGRGLALRILRPEVIALRRLVISEAREFPSLATEYFERAPGHVLEALTSGFARLGRAGLLRVADARRAAAQFAYLVAGETLDRAMLVGTPPPRAQLVAFAREGVETFLARYAPREPLGSARRRQP